jgi:hypothetical protein
VGDVAAVTHLIENHNVDVDAVDDAGTTALHEAALKRQWAVVGAITHVQSRMFNHTCSITRAQSRMLNHSRLFNHAVTSFQSLIAIATHFCSIELASVNDYLPLLPIFLSRFFPYQVFTCLLFQTYCFLVTTLYSLIRSFPCLIR